MCGRGSRRAGSLKERSRALQEKAEGGTRGDSTVVRCRGLGLIRKRRRVCRGGSLLSRRQGEGEKGCTVFGWYRKGAASCQSRGGGGGEVGQFPADGSACVEFSAHGFLIKQAPAPGEGFKHCQPGGVEDLAPLRRSSLRDTRGSRLRRWQALVRGDSQRSTRGPRVHGAPAAGALLGTPEVGPYGTGVRG